LTGTSRAPVGAGSAARCGRVKTITLPEIVSRVFRAAEPPFDVVDSRFHPDCWSS
jgi:hypothetical protein